MTSAYSVFPNQGVRMRPYSVLKVTDREGNVLEENRPEPQGRDPRRHGVRDDQPAARRRRSAAPARKADGAQLAARRQDRHDRRLHRRVVHRLRSRHHDRRVGRLRPEEADRPSRHRRGAGAADLDGHHEGVDRRPHGTADLRGARQHRVRVGRQAAPATPPSKAPPGAITEAFIAGTQPGSGFRQ